MAIIAMGTSRATPPTNTRQTISTGIARAIRTEATIFATPQVSLKARPMAFTSSQIKIAMVSNSNIFDSFLILRLRILSNQMRKKLIFPNDYRIVKLIFAAGLTIGRPQVTVVLRKVPGFCPQNTQTSFAISISPLMLVSNGHITVNLTMLLQTHNIENQCHDCKHGPTDIPSGNLPIRGISAVCISNLKRKIPAK